MPIHFRRLSFFECMGIQFFNLLTRELREAMPRQMSLTLFSHVTYGTLCHVRGHSHFFPIPFFLLLPHVTGTPPQLRRPREGPPLALSSNPTLGGFFCFLTPPLAPFFTVSATGLRERFLLPGAFYLTLLIPGEAEDFPRGDRYFKHVPPPTYLIYLSLKDLYR